jgi:hypothetical protein
VFVSSWTLGLDLWRVVVDGRSWTGTDGLFLTDQMQYLAWIQSASRHLLVADLFVVNPGSADYLQPLVAISGGLTALGMAAWLSMLVWQPIAVVAMFFAVRGFARRGFDGRGAQRAALVIGLFGGWFPGIGDMWPGFWSWGYPFALLAIAAMPAALVSYERARSAGRLSWLPAALGASASWFHPWQGETLALIVVFAELLMWTRAGRRPARRQLTLPAVTVIVTVLPLLYYVVLARVDPQWGMARVSSRHTFPLSTIGMALAPLLVAALLAYRRPAVGFLAIATRLWLPAVLVVYLVSESGFSDTPLHAFAGVTVPLGVLSVEGVLSLGLQRLRARGLLGACLVAAVTIPTSVDELKGAAEYLVPTPGNANFIAPEERAALDRVARDRQPGAVLSRGYLGLIAPGLTGRQVYLGSCQWSEPNCDLREQLVQRVFQAPNVPAAAIRAEVLSTGARFVLNSTCALPGKDLDRALAPITGSVLRFGCATLYVLRAPRTPSGLGGNRQHGRAGRG